MSAQPPPPAGLPPISFDKVLGALLVGTWGDSILLAIECMMVYRYFHKFSRDRWTLKSLVLIVLAIDCISSIGNYAYVYLYTITNWGNPAYLQRQHWPIIVFLPTTGMSACIVQMFLISRLWRLTRSWFIIIPLACTSLASCAGAWGTSIITMLHPLFQDRARVSIPCTIWLVGSAISDCGIALALLWQLANARTSQFKQTRGVVTRLMGSAIQTGSGPAVLALATLVAFLVDKESNICVGLGFCLGRVYALTLIYNLMIRGSQSRSTSRVASHSVSHGSHQHMTTDRHPVDLGMGISVHRTAVVHIDDGAGTKHAGDIAMQNYRESMRYQDDIKTQPMDMVGGDLERGSQASSGRPRTPFEDALKGNHVV